MNFLAIDQTLRTVLNAISGLPVPLAQDDGQSQYFAQAGSGIVTDGHGNVIGTSTNQQATITYDVISVLGVGWDEWRDRYDASVKQVGDTYPGNLGSVITEATGNRELHIQVKCESFDGQDGAGPLPIIERVRTAIGLPSVLELLNAAGLAIQSVGSSVVTFYNDDNGRRVNVGVLGIIFNGADGVDDLPVTTIEQLDMPKPGAGLTVFGLVTDT